ncbi:MAG: hypothetical protein QW096_10200, partial [Thermofilaceae archaeon]
MANEKDIGLNHNQSHEACPEPTSCHDALLTNSSKESLLARLPSSAALCKKNSQPKPEESMKIIKEMYFARSSKPSRYDLIIVNADKTTIKMF